MILPKSKNGFTLIELLIVIAIISILATIGFASYTRARQSARDTERKSNLRDVQSALERFYSDFNRYPNSNASGQIQDTSCTGGGLEWGSEGLVCGSRTYIKQLPEDPNGTGYFYQSCSSQQQYTLFARLEGLIPFLSTISCPPNPDDSIYKYWVIPL